MTNRCEGMMLVRGLFIFVFSLFLNGCEVSYVTEQGLIYLAHLNRAKSIQEILKNPKKYKLSDEEVQKLKLIQDVQKYAIEKIGLKESQNYTKYIKLKDDRRAFVYLVLAANKYELKPYYWDFPVSGRVPYKGFFELEKAKALGKELESQGYDVSLRGSVAFSTLGWFSDPVNSSMLHLDDLEIMDLIFHEMTHDTVYFPGDSDFNESFATFVGSQTTLLYVTDKYGKNSKEVSLQKQRISDSKIFSQFVNQSVNQLKEKYKNIKTERERNKVFKELKESFKKLPLKTDQYLFFEKSKLNNAIILSFNTYYTSYGKFEKELQNISLKDFLEKYKNK